MANTITFNNDTITLEAIDSDWTWTTTLSKSKYAQGVTVTSVQFTPGDTDDICVLKDSVDTGAAWFESGYCADKYDTKIKYYDRKLQRPMLDYSAGTYSAGAKVIIEITRM